MSKWLYPRPFGGLLRRATRLARAHAEAQAELTAAFMDRYGTTYSDIDADKLIDALDYGNGATLNTAQVDAIMEKAGWPLT